MHEQSDPVQHERKQWEAEQLAEALQRHPERSESFTNDSGRTIERLYLPGSIADDAGLDKLGFPGRFPYTRGIQPTMYRGRLWTVRQYAGFGTALESNRRFRYLLDQGNTGLSIAFDLPTQIGYDSDDPVAMGEVGRVGVAIDSLADMETLFAEIPLERVSTSMTINATAGILLAMYIAVGEQQGIDPARLTGTIQNDILKEYIARGTYRFAPEPALRLTRDILSYCTEHLPRFNSISISGYHMREAGATAAQEIGFTLANAICYIDNALKAGQAIDDFAPRLAFFFAAHSDFFEEIAKFRAARRLYARIMTERFKAKNPKSCMLRFHTQTGGVTLTAQDPDNNVVRVTLQALAAVLGGTQSLHTNARDEALSLPSEEAVRLALNTQHIIAHESGVANTVDPLGGSAYLERLTDELEAEAEAFIDQIDEMGGVVKAIGAGWMQRQIEQSAFEFGQRIETGQRTVVGVNKYASGENIDIKLFNVPEEILQQQIERLEQTRRDRDQARVDAALELLRSKAEGDDNLMPPLLEAVRAYATMGEICRTLGEVFEEYRDPFS